MTGYCGFCRAWFGSQENPPYAVIHVDGDPALHLHPESREELAPRPDGGTDD